MADQFLSRPAARLAQLRKRHQRVKRWHELIQEDGETKADMEKRAARMRAEGKVHPDDSFIYTLII